MIVVYCIAAAVLVLLLLPAALYYGAYVYTGDPYPRTMAVRFVIWAAATVLATFNIGILRHIIVTILSWF